MAWKLKLTEDGAAVLKDGLPVFVDDSGSETPIDPNQMHQKILQVNAESKSRREKLQEMEARLAPVKDVEDLTSFLDEATKAMETVRNLEDAQLVKAGEVEKIKREALQGLELQETKLKSQFQQREESLQKELSRRDQNIRQLLISNRFAQSDLFAGANRRTHLLPDFAEARFGHHFDVVDKDGNLSVVGKDPSGEVIMSKDPKRFGEPADFDEAMEVIFNSYPQKDQLLRSGPGGSGATGGTEGVTRKTPVAELRRQLAEATKAGRATDMVRLTRELFELQKHGG